MNAPTSRLREFLQGCGRWPILLGAVLVVATLLAYLPATHGGYIWDDDVYVTENPLLPAPDGLQRIWFSLDSPSQYFPLVYTTFRIEYAIWGLNPAGYHWVNILLHIANALLVWGLLRRLRIPGAWLAAMIFALHPVQVESVAWITERKNVLMLLFFLLSLLAWTRFIGDVPRRRWWFYALALGCHALALFAKTTACTLPAALLLILWLEHRPIDRRRIAQTIPFFALSLGMGLVTIWWERYHQGTHGSLFALTLADRALVASHAVWFYAWKLLWPASLAFSYPHWTLHPWNPLAWGWLFGLVVIAWAIYCAREDLGRGPEVAAVYFVATLGPILGFIMLYTFLYSYVADHYQYAACIGPIALASAGLATLIKRRPDLGTSIVFATALVLIGLGALTWQQCHIYKDGEAIWRDTMAKNPDSLMAHFNLANQMSREGKYREAFEHYSRALEIDPTFNEARCNRAQLLTVVGKPAAAAADYAEALRLNPKDALTQNAMGDLLKKMGQPDEAIGHYAKAVEIEPHYTMARKNLGDALAARGRFAEAVPSYQEVAKQLPQAPQSHLLLARAYLAAGDQAGAIREYREVLKITPQSLEGLGRLAGLLASADDPKLRNGKEAVALAQQLCDLTQDKSIGALATLAEACAEDGRFADAVAASLSAIELAKEEGNTKAAEGLERTMRAYQEGRRVKMTKPE